MIFPSLSTTWNTPLVTSSMSAASSTATVTPSRASGSRMLLMCAQSPGRATRVPSYLSRLTIDPTPSNVYSSNRSAPGTVQSNKCARRTPALHANTAAHTSWGHPSTRQRKPRSVRRRQGVDDPEEEA